MQSEGIIAALLGALTGGGGIRLASRLFGPERTKTIIGYQLEVIEATQKENRELRKRLAKMETRMLALEDAVSAVTEGELPPEYS